jgi:hypothetical protein
MGGRQVGRGGSAGGHLSRAPTVLRRIGSGHDIDLTAAWVDQSRLGQDAEQQRARYYTVTEAGLEQLGTEQAEFADLVRGIARVMRQA